MGPLRGLAAELRQQQSRGRPHTATPHAATKELRHLFERIFFEVNALDLDSDTGKQWLKLHAERVQRKINDTGCNRGEAIGLVWREWKKRTNAFRKMRRLFVIAVMESAGIPLPKDLAKQPE